MRRLFNLRMKENGSVAHHINDFESTFTQMRAQQMNLDDELKAIFLLCSLLASWDTFCTAVSNFAPNGNLGGFTICRPSISRAFEAYFRTP